MTSQLWVIILVLRGGNWKGPGKAVGRYTRGQLRPWGSGQPPAQHCFGDPLVPRSWMITSSRGVCYLGPFLLFPITDRSDGRVWLLACLAPNTVHSCLLPTSPTSPTLPTLCQTSRCSCGRLAANCSWPEESSVHIHIHIHSLQPAWGV